MAGRLPRTQAVLAAAQRVLTDAGTVVSLTRFLDLVRQRLHEEAPDAPLGPQRLKRMMAEAPFCRIELRTRAAEGEDPPARCPICGRGLETVRNQTLFGEPVDVARRCPRCPYRAGRHRRVPTLYIFHKAGR